MNSIIYYNNDGNADTNDVYRLLLGITVSTENSKYVYDAASGYGNISEDVMIASVNSGSLAETLGLQPDDRIAAVIINGTTHTIDRSFDIENLALTIRPNDIIQIVCERGGKQLPTESLTVSLSNLTAVA